MTKTSKKVKSDASAQKSIRVLSVIKAPVITEKGTKLTEHNQVLFFVDTSSTKSDIKKAVEEIFSVKVKSVNTMLVKGKRKAFKGRSYVQQSKKKAVVRLEEGHRIDMGSGI